MDTPEDPSTVTFEQHRRLLLAMGYRMLGSRAEAEELGKVCTTPAAMARCETVTT